MGKKKPAGCGRNDGLSFLVCCCEVDFDVLRSAEASARASAILTLVQAGVPALPSGPGGPGLCGLGGIGGIVFLRLGILGNARLTSSRSGGWGALRGAFRGRGRILLRIWGRWGGPCGG